MKVTVANNVVALPRGGKLAMGKTTAAKADAADSSGNSAGADVRVLFPQMRTAQNSWLKTHKQVGKADSDPRDPNEADDQANGQDIFGSLVASVEQKLTGRDEQSAEANTDPATGQPADTPLRRTSPLLRHDALSAALQNAAQMNLSDAKASGAFSNASAAEPHSPFAAGMNFTVIGRAEEGHMPKLLNTGAEPQGKATEAPTDPETANPSEVTAAMASAGPTAPSVDEKAKASLVKEAPLQPGDTKTANPNVTVVTAVNGLDGKQLRPVAQIVENIKNAAPAAPVAAAESPAAPQMAKALEIQLRPEGLGVVTVSLKSEQGKLKVQISAKLDTTRQELERNSVDLVNGLRTVDPTFTDVDVNFSDGNQGASADAKGQAFSNGGERRGTPENMSGFGANGGQDADQANPNSRNSVYGKARIGEKLAVGDLPSHVARADGIYL
jgi:flagellar hook-length control protein FliK